MGRLLDSTDAGTIGLVDRVVNKSDLMSEAKDEMQKWLAIPGIASLCNFVPCHAIGLKLIETKLTSLIVDVTLSVLKLKLLFSVV